MAIENTMVTRVLSILLSVTVGSIIGSFATFVTFSERVTAMESKILSRDDIKDIINTVTPWVRDKEYISLTIERLDKRQTATEQNMIDLKVQQSRMVVLLDRVGEDVRTLVNKSEGK